MDQRNLLRRLNDISKQRSEQYGSFDGNMKNIASVWSVLLTDYLVKDIPGWMIPLMFSAMKIVRASHKFKQDNYDDAAVYLFQANDMQEKQEQEDADQEMYDQLLGIRTGQRNEPRKHVRKNGKTFKGI